MVSNNKIASESHSKKLELSIQELSFLDWLVFSIANFIDRMDQKPTVEKNETKAVSNNSQTNDIIEILPLIYEIIRWWYTQQINLVII